MIKLCHLLLTLRIKFYYWRKNRFELSLFNKILIFENKNSPESDLARLCNFIKKNGLTVFPYDFYSNYFNFDLDIYIDDSTYFVLHKGERMYFPNSWNNEKVKKYYLGLLAEQDKSSPHLYCDDDFCVDQDDTLIDIGGAEGFFALEYISIAKKVIIFENNILWYEPLLKTFRPFQDKVEVLRKFVGSKSSGTFVKLDDFSDLFHIPLFIKIDVDGSEMEVLKGMRELLSINKRIKIAICTYHRQDDFDDFSIFLRSYGFKLSASSGYMLYFLDRSQKSPYFRKGVLRASNIFKV